MSQVVVRTRSTAKTTCLEGRRRLFLIHRTVFLWIVRTPPRSRLLFYAKFPSTATPLYNQPSNQCHETTYSIPDSSSLCAGGSGGGSPGPVSSASPTAPAEFPSLSATSYASSAYQANPTGKGYTPTTLTTVSSAAPASPSCTWKGHCLGDPCHTFNDCFGSDVCTHGICVSCTGGSFC